MSRLFLSSLFGLVLLSGCATTGNGTAQSTPAGQAPPPPAVQPLSPVLGPLPGLLHLMEGSFSPAPGETNDFHVRSFYFSAPGLPGAAVYSQINSGPDRAVYRQRVTLLTANPDDTVTARSFALVDAASLIDAWDKGDALHGLTPADLQPGFEAVAGSSCDMIWRRTGEASWEGRISHTDCQIHSPRRNAQIGLEAITLMDAAGTRQTERGYSADGTQLFGTPQGSFITLRRVR